MGRGVSKAQIFSWFLMVVILPMVSFCVNPLFWPYAVSGHLISWLFLCVQVVAITLVDPAPYAVRRRRAQGHIPPLKPPRKGHIIQNGFCTICDVDVSGTGSKHCKRCNKCCEQFDHHCVWLNTCIGGRNYKMFLCLIIYLASYLTVWMFAIVSVVICGFTQLAEVVPAFQTTKSGDQLEIGWAGVVSFRSPAWLPIPLVGWILVDVVAFLMLLIFDGLILHLLFFHYKINKEGVTTYAFIQKQRKGASLLLQRATTDTVTGNSIDARGATTTTTTASAAPDAVQQQQQQEPQPPRPPSVPPAAVAAAAAAHAAHEVIDEVSRDSPTPGPFEISPPSSPEPEPEPDPEPDRSQQEVVLVPERREEVYRMEGGASTSREDERPSTSQRHHHPRPLSSLSFRSVTVAPVGHNKRRGTFIAHRPHSSATRRPSVQVV